jgi:hypothetical protein
MVGERLWYTHQLHTMEDPLPPDYHVTSPIDDTIVSHIMQLARPLYDQALRRATAWARRTQPGDWSTLTDDQKAYWIAAAAWEILEERRPSQVKRLLQAQSIKHKQELEENQTHYVQLLLSAMQNLGIRLRRDS